MTDSPIVLSLPYRPARLIAALMLASALWMPAYTCSGYRSPTGELLERIPSGVDSSAYTPTEIPHRPIEEVAPRQLDFWVSILAYTWPLLIFALRQGLKRRRASRWLRWTEPLLAGLGAWFIWSNASVGKIAYGSWVALTATTALCLLAVTELVRHRAPKL